MSIFGRSQEVDVSEPDAGVCNARLIETPYRDPDLATPERLAEVRRAGVPEAPFTDFELFESKPNRFVFRDRATGIEYRRDESWRPLENGDTVTARDFACFTVDAGGKLHLLRRRGQPRTPTTEIFHGSVRGARVA